MSTEAADPVILVVDSDHHDIGTGITGQAILVWLNPENRRRNNEQEQNDRWNQ